VSGVFVNYRTGDEDGVAILLDRELSGHFGADRVFRAGRSIAPGDAWGPAILAAVRRSDVLIAVIGRRWLTAPGRGGRALDDERDWTRREIVEAFASGVRVIPVLVGTTVRLTETDLPAELAPLAGCQYLRIDQHDVDAGIRRLLETLQVRNSGRSAPPGTPRHAGVSDWKRYPVGIDHQRLLAADRVIDQLLTFLGGETTGPAVTISGAGGLGKTAVTYEAVSTLTGSQRFTKIVWVSAKNGVFQTSQAAGDPATVDWHDVLRVIAEQLGCQLSPSRRLWERDVGQHVRRRDGTDRILLVVDNLEGIDDAQQVIGRLGTLGLGRPHKLVATTRWAVTSNDYDVPDIRIRPLGAQDTIALVRQIGAGDDDLADADDSSLLPIHQIAEGNPFLVKLIVRRYLRTGRPLTGVIAELTSLGTGQDHHPTLGGAVRRYLYEQSLDELASRFDRHSAQRLMAAFCFAPRGETLDAGELRAWSELPDRAAFDQLLEAACGLALIRPSQRNLRYSIHSLLYEFTCSAPPTE
jgi:hypothetical protein